MKTEPTPPPDSLGSPSCCASLGDRIALADGVIKTLESITAPAISEVRKVRRKLVRKKIRVSNPIYKEAEEDRKRRRNIESKKRAHSHCSRWGEEDQEALIKMIGIKTIAQISNEIGRTRKSVKAKIYAMRKAGILPHNRELSEPKSVDNHEND